MRRILEAAVVLLFLGSLWLIARREADWRSRPPKPWAPKMGPLIRVRPWIFPYGWALATVGLAGLPLALAGDHADAAVTGSVILGAMGFLFETRMTYPLLGAAVPVPSGATVRPSKGRFTYGALSAGLLVVLVTPFAVVDLALRNDTDLIIAFCAYPLGIGLGSLLRGRRVVRWENDHHVEFLRARWQRGSQELYVRPRTGETGDRAEQGTRRRQSSPGPR